MPTTFPAYLNHCVHPGMYSPANITEGLTQVNPVYNDLFAKIMVSCFPRTPSASNPFTDREITILQQSAWNILKERLITSIDRTVNTTFCTDRECHEKTLKALEPYLGGDLTTLTSSDLEKIIRDVHQGIFPDSYECKSPSGAYRPTNVFIYNFNVPGTFFDTTSMIPYLETTAPHELIAYRSLMDKLILYARTTSSRDIITFYHRRGLTLEEKALLNKYLIIPPPATEVPALMNAFIKELLLIIQEGVDPITIAGFVHGKIIDIHPFRDGNGRLARALMNLILVKAGLPPVVFLSAEEYMAATNETRSSEKNIFEDLVRAKVEANRGKEAVIIEAELGAQAIQTLWGKVSMQMQWTLISEPFETSLYSLD